MSKKDAMSKKEMPQMPSPRDYSSRNEWEAACWEKIVGSEELLRLVVTSHERHDIVMRIAALARLVSGVSYQKIGEELWLSPQTISGIKKAVSEKTYRSYLERSKKERKKRVCSTIGEPRWHRPRGTPRRTKYGVLYVP